MYPKRPTKKLIHYPATVLAILWKDLQFESRGREIISVWVSMGLFIFAIFAIGSSNIVEAAQTSGPGFIWISLALLSTIGLTQSFRQEHALGTWSTLLMAPVDHSAIFFGKFLSNIVFTLVSEIPILGVYMIFVGVPKNLPVFLLAIAFGSACIVAVGTLLAAFLMSKSRSELLLPIMLLPIITPVVAFASQLMIGATTGAVSGYEELAFVFLLAYDLITIFGAAAAFSMITELY